MKIFLFCLSLFFLGERLLAIPEAPENSSNGSTLIRVLIDKASDAVRLSTFGPRLKVQVENAATPFFLSKELSVSLSGDQTRFLIRNKTLPMKWLAISSSDGVSPLSLGGHIYRGALWLRVQEKKILVINVLPLEDYLLGTLGAEMSPSWEMEALKAQAVASRSYALSRIKHPKNEFYDVEKTIEDQVYDGINAENPRVRRAVEQTAAQWISQDQRPVRAYFHSKCGGSTESSTSVWNGKTEFGNVDCPYCQKFRSTWKASFSIEELREAVGLPTAQRGLHLFALHISPAGRVLSLKISDGLTEKILTSNQLRGELGYQKLKSALFHWKIRQKTITFEGLGSGHGVGMCQWGARFLAQQGKTYREILAFYYPGTQLTMQKVLHS